MRVAHISDVHFGRITHPTILDALVDEVNAGGTDLVVLSGDLTQRARTRQFKDAAALIAAFDAPVIVVPGNHDVYAWWRPFKRLFDPLARYRRYVTDDLFPTFLGKGTAVLGINTAFGRTIKGGRVSSRTRRFIARFFADQPESVFKILVMHHHLVRLQALEPHDVARQASRTLEVAVENGIDLILCGHLHESHVEPIEVASGRKRMVVASAGTATSNRGRRSNREHNYYNIISIGDRSFLIEERKFDTENGIFEPIRSFEYDRH